MADTVQFDLVSPERLLTSVQARQVQMPGAEGDLTAMADHSPLITTLRPGVVRVTSDKGEEDEYAVTGGFAEINGDSISVLAERAVHRTDLTQERFDSLIADAKERLEKARETYQNEPGPVDDAAKLLADMVAIGDHMGLSTSSSAAAP